MSADSFMNSILIREKGPIRTEGLQKCVHVQSVLCLLVMISYDFCVLI